MSTLRWIEKWFLSHCDRDWEQENKLTITSLGNPGWLIEIDLNETSLEGLEFDMETIDTGESWPSKKQNWWYITIKDNKFNGSGDASKLEFLLNKFKTVADTKDLSLILKQE